MDILKVVDRPILMGILNVTPDSFSDGGRYLTTEDAVEQGRKLFTDGADIVDVGGESTRPGSSGIEEKEEKRRVLPVIRELAKNSNAHISVDTTKAGVADEALFAGANMINDVTMLRNGDDLARVAARHKARLVLMHSRKTPETMQTAVAYDDLVPDIIRELRQAVTKALRAGVEPEQIWIDPGIGFAKTPEQNLELLAKTREFTCLGYPVLVGPSRKSFIGTIAGGKPLEREAGTAAAITAAILGGAHAIRVHDVASMKQAATIAFGISRHLTSLDRGQVSNV